MVRKNDFLCNIRSVLGWYDQIQHQNISARMVLLDQLLGAALVRGRRHMHRSTGAVHGSAAPGSSLWLVSLSYILSTFALG